MHGCNLRTIASSTCFCVVQGLDNNMEESMKAIGGDSGEEYEKEVRVPKPTAACCDCSLARA